MNIEKALNRINWRFTNENVKINESKIIINQNDIDSVKFITNWINQQKQFELKENEMFAKLFCHVFIQEYNYYKDFKFAQKGMHEILHFPIEHHYEKFCKEVNRIDFEQYLKSIEIETNHLKNLNKQQREKEAEIKTENKKTIEKYLKGVWTKENIFKSLNNTITEFIVKYKNPITK